MNRYAVFCEKGFLYLCKKCQSIYDCTVQMGIHRLKFCATLGIFFLINAPGAMQNIDREPLFCSQFTKQKVCPILYFRDV